MAREPTLLPQQSVPARMGMQIVGLSQISLTLGTYSHVVPELAQEAAERIDRVLWAPWLCKWLMCEDHRKHH